MKQSISKNLPKLHFFQFCKSILCNPFLFFSVGNQVAGLQTNGGSRPHDLKRLHELIITTTLLLEILISVSVIWGIIKYTYSLIEKKIILKSLLVVMGWVRFLPRFWISHWNGLKGKLNKVFLSFFANFLLKLTIFQIGS